MGSKENCLCGTKVTLRRKGKPFKKKKKKRIRKKLSKRKRMQLTIISQEDIPR